MFARIFFQMLNFCCHVSGAANGGGRVRNEAGAEAGAGTLPKLLAQRHDKKSCGGTSVLETTNSSIEKIDTFVL